MKLSGCIIKNKAGIGLGAVSLFGYRFRHGRASAMLAIGKGIAGGRVVTNGWPGLAAANLENGQDLKVTLDYRDVLAEIVQKRLGNTNLDYIFPTWTPTFRGVTR